MFILGSRPESTLRVPALPTGVLSAIVSVNEWARWLAVERFCSRLPTDGAGLLDCWLWQGFLGRAGYGRYGDRVTGFTKEIYVHRIVAEAVYGPIPRGMEVDHLCHVRNCVNPLHLRICTLAENRRNRQPSKTPLRTHCPHGHPYSGSNLYVHPVTGHRECRVCKRSADRRWLAKDGNRERQNELRRKRRSRESGPRNDNPFPGSKSTQPRK